MIVSLPPSRVPLATPSSADLLIAWMDGWVNRLGWGWGWGWWIDGQKDT